MKKIRVKIILASICIFLLFFFLLSLKKQVNEVAQSKEYKMEHLAQYRSSDLYALYLGTENGKRIPQICSINFYDNLKKLWNFKIARSPDNKIVTETGDILLTRYRYGKITLLSLREYLILIRQEMREVRLKLIGTK